MFTDTQKEILGLPLDSKKVKTREKGKALLSYIEGWQVISEANRIFGYDAWHRETVYCTVVNESHRAIGKDNYKKDGFSVSYICKVKITVGNVVREGTGAGHQIDADLGAAHEGAIKEAETDAMKRALMTFGNAFGLALYDKKQENVSDNVPNQEELEQLKIDELENKKLTDAQKEKYKKELESLKSSSDIGNWWRDNKYAINDILGSAESKYFHGMVMELGTKYKEAL